MKKFIEKFCNIRNVMALILTLTFAALAIMRVVSANEFMTVLTAVIVYFFWRQHRKWKRRAKK